MYGSNSGKHLSRWLTSSIHLPTFLIMNLSAYQKFFPALVSCSACWPQSAALSGPVRRAQLRGWKWSVSTAAWHWGESLTAFQCSSCLGLSNLQYICFLLFVSSIFPIYCYSFWRESTTRPQNQRNCTVAQIKGLWSLKYDPKRPLLVAFSF